MEYERAIREQYAKNMSEDQREAQRLKVINEQLFKSLKQGKGADLYGQVDQEDIDQFERSNFNLNSLYRKLDRDTQQKYRNLDFLWGKTENNNNNEYDPYENSNPYQANSVYNMDFLP